MFYDLTFFLSNYTAAKTLTVTLYSTTGGTVSQGTAAVVQELPGGTGSTSNYSITVSIPLGHRGSLQVFDGTTPVGGQAINAQEFEAPYSAVVVYAAVNEASATTTQFKATGHTTTPLESSNANEYAGAIVAFTTGGNARKYRKVTGYTPATGQFTVSPAWPSAPANGDQFVIVGKVG